MLQKSECSPTIDASPERSRRTRNPSISNAGRRGLWARKRCVRCRWLTATFDQTGWLAGDCVVDEYGTVPDDSFRKCPDRHSR
jgi:hypothetical protein